MTSREQRVWEKIQNIEAEAVQHDLETVHKNQKMRTVALALLMLVIALPLLAFASSSEKLFPEDRTLHLQLAAADTDGDRYVRVFMDVVGGDGSPGTMDFRRAAAMLNDTATGQVLRGEVVPIYLKNGGVRLLAEFETFMTPGPRQAKVWIDGRALTSNSIDVDSLTRGSARWRN